jgi:hypothetical protein
VVIAPQLFKELLNHLDFLRDGLKVTSDYDIARTLGLIYGGTELPRALEMVQDIDHRENKPFRSSLVIGIYRVPFPSYFVKARCLGHFIHSNPMSEYCFWADQMERLGVPRPDNWEESEVCGP